MINSLIHHPCEISLHVLSEDIFVHPPPPNSELPGRDKTLNGVVEIRAPSERTIQGVKVVLQALQTLTLPDSSSSSTPGGSRHEEKILLEKTVEIHSDGFGGTTTTHKSHKSKGKEKERERGRAATVTAQRPGGDRHEGDAEAAATSNGALPVTSAHEDGIHLDKGLHGFEFSLIIPASSPPIERHRNGRVRYILTATAIGGGRGKTNVSIWREIFIFTNVNPDGGPVPLDIQYHDVHDALGALSVSLTSASLTVGGTANLSVYHPEPPHGLSIHVIRVFLEQTVEIYSSIKKAWLKLPVEKLRLWEKGFMPYKQRPADAHGNVMGIQDGIWLTDESGEGRPGKGVHASPAPSGTTSPFGVPQGMTSGSGSTTPGTPFGHGVVDTAVVLPSQHGYKIRSTIRLPDDNVIRPSTVRGSRAEVRVSHELGVEVFFSRLSVIDDRENSDSFGKPKVQVFSMRRATMIPSCCCTFDTVHLPPYSRESPANSRPTSPAPGMMATSPPAGATQSEIDHWRLTQSLRAALPHASGPPMMGGVSAPGSRHASRPASRDPSPERHSRGLGLAAAFGHGRRSRNSSPEREGTHSVGSFGSSGRGRGRGGLSGLGALTPAHGGGGGSSSNNNQSNAYHHTGPASGATTPRSLPASYPWIGSHLPPRTATSHRTCNCGRTTEELTEAEGRLLEGIPTAPGAWVDTHEDGAEPPPWTPSRPASPDLGIASIPGFSSRVSPGTSSPGHQEARRKFQEAIDSRQ